MKIGIDCQAVNLSYKGGINSYLFGLLNGFSSISSEHEFVIFINKGELKQYNKFFLNSNFSFVELANFKGIVRKFFVLIPYILNSTFLWRIFLNFYSYLFGVTRKIEASCDLLYTATTVLNFYNFKIPTFVSVHDIQQFHYPEFFSNHDLKIRRLSFSNTFLKANYIQASSLFIKEDILKHYKNIKPENIKVIPEGVDLKAFSKNTKSNDNSKYNLPSKYLFMPAQLWKHKNHLTVLKAIKILQDKGIKIPLVLCGEKFSSSKEIFDYINLNKLSDVYYLGKVPFEDLIKLYHGAFYLITAVLYESSSLPVLEAAVAELPVIASNTPPNQETSEHLIMHLFEPTNYEELSIILEKAFNNHDQKERERITSNNKESIKQFSWSNIASKYQDFFEGKIDS